jgi:hypothetical protein
VLAEARHALYTCGMRRVALLFVLGAVVLSFFDGFHTHSGTTEYTHPVALRMAWWVPLLFGTTAALGGWLYATGHRRLGGGEAVPSWPRVAGAFFGFAGLYFLSGFWAAPDAIKLAALAGGGVVLWLVVDRTWQGALLAVPTMIGGCAVEIALVHVDAFRYVHGSLLGVALWLPGLYLAATPAVGQLARRVLAVQPAG